MIRFFQYRVELLVEGRSRMPMSAVFRDSLNYNHQEVEHIVSKSKMISATIEDRRRFLLDTYQIWFSGLCINALRRFFSAFWSAIFRFELLSTAADSHSQSSSDTTIWAQWLFRRDKVCCLSLLEWLKEAKSNVILNNSNDSNLFELSDPRQVALKLVIFYRRNYFSETKWINWRCQRTPMA